MRALIARLLRIHPDEARFARRGFAPTTPALQARLEGIGVAFLDGYHQALNARDPAALNATLARVPRADAGFAHEGAAMALALLDALLCGRGRRVRRFLAGSGAAHVYMVHVGVGWAVARLPFGRRRILRRLDPLLRWLAIDGYGFHEGYFHPARCRISWRPRWTTGYLGRAFNQGLGRSLWFSCGADVDRIGATIAALPQPRHADLWAGVGLAAAYAGGQARAELGRLVAAAGPHRASLAQGAAFATTARWRAGNLLAETAQACQALTGETVARVTALTMDALDGLPTDGDHRLTSERPAFEHWRARIQSALAPETAMGAVL